MKPDFSTHNPATGEKLSDYHLISDQALDQHIDSAFQLWQKNRNPGVQERSAYLLALAKEFRGSADSLALQMTLEMGKTLTDSLAEIEKSAATFQYFSEQLGSYRAVEVIDIAKGKGMIVKDSWGPLLAVMPWNFPLWQITRVVVSSVGIGNPILLKHSEITAGTAVKIQEIFDRVQKGLLTNLCISHDQAARVIQDPRVRGVSLTGSARAGREIGAVAAKSLKKTVLELGGSDAYLVFADADAELAGKICATARMTNNGQSCVAAKRFIIETKVKSAFLASFHEHLSSLKRGDPQKKETQVGCLAHKKFQTQLLEQCEKIEKEGAKKVFDHADVQKEFGLKEGAFFPARVYEISKNSKLLKTEEFFGPVALVVEVSSDEEAVKVANESIYGLGGAIFSRNLKRAELLAHQMECGFVAINNQVKSDAQLPFGGMKDSGYGRELSKFGFDEFCNVKSLAVSEP